MNNLKKAVIIFGLSIFTLFFLWSPGHAALKFAFKITGGINWQLLGDPDGSLNGRKAYIDDYMKHVGSSYTLDESPTPFAAHFGWEFDADAILYFTPRFGVSLGTGYIQGGTIFGSGNTIITSATTKETDYCSTTVSAIPLKFGIYYTFSSAFAATGKSSSYLFAGMGYYLANYSFSEKYNYQTYYSNYSEKAKAGGIGFYAGFGGESWINPNFAFIYEISGRYVKIGGLTGDWQLDDNGSTASGSGRLYYYEYLHSSYNTWYPHVEVWDAAPSGSTYRNVKDAKLDFTGISLKFGFKINI